MSELLAAGAAAAAGAAFSRPGQDEHSVFFEIKTGEIGQTRKWEGRRVELNSLAVIVIAQIVRF